MAFRRRGDVSALSGRYLPSNKALNDLRDDIEDSVLAKVTKVVNELEYSSLEIENNVSIGGNVTAQNIVSKKSIHTGDICAAGKIYADTLIARQVLVQQSSHCVVDSEVSLSVIDFSNVSTITMDSEYVPTQNQNVATKTYVDTQFSNQPVLSDGLQTNKIIAISPLDKLEVVADGGMSLSGDVECQYLKTKGFKTQDAGAFSSFSDSEVGVSGSGSVETSIDATSGQVLALQFNATSDRRKKQNICSIEESDAEAFMKVQSCRFQWKGKSQRCFGFIAQDILRVCKQNPTLKPLVQSFPCENLDGGEDVETGVQNPASSCLSVNYDGCTAILHRALQIEIEKNKKLEQRLTLLENQVKCCLEKMS